MRRPFRIGATRHMMVPERTSTAKYAARAYADVKCPMHALTRPCQQACEPTMNKPSERIVVFVTTAQKRAITSTAENLGISVSELMRRAVLSFGATSEQVKAASIVDRLRAPRAPDALNAALQRVARGTRYARAALPAQLQGNEDETGASASADETVDEAVDEASASTAQSRGAASSSVSASPARGASATAVLPLAPAAAESAPLLPAGLAAALAAEVDLEAAATAEAVARVAAARSATFDESALQQAETEAQLRRVLKRPRVDRPLDDDDPRNDPSTEGGRFA